MAECLHHGERLVASADVSIMIFLFQFLPGFPGFQLLWQEIRIGAITPQSSEAVVFERRRSKPGGRRTAPAGRRIEIGRPGAWESLLFQAIL
jgi:hypothetical protein